MRILTRTGVRGKMIAGCVLAVALGSVAALADDKSGSHEHSSSTSTENKDVKFVKAAMEGNQAEVAMAEVAARKAQSPELKSFAQQLKQDHTQANQQLQPIAQSLGVQVSQTMKEKHQEELARLQKLEGTEFDQHFAKHALRDHVKDIAKYQKASTQVQNAQLKEYVNQTLPKLQQHLQHGKEVAQKVGIDQATITSIEKESPEAIGGSESMEEDTTSGSKYHDEDKSSKGAGARELKDQSKDE